MYETFKDMNTKPLPFQCDLCDRAFPSRASRSMHRIRTHHIKLDGSPAQIIKPNMMKQDEIDRIIALRKEGMSHRNIAKEVGRNLSTVQRTLVKAGLRVRELKTRQSPDKYAETKRAYSRARYARETAGLPGRVKDIKAQQAQPPEVIEHSQLNYCPVCSANLRAIRIAIRVTQGSQ